MSNNSFKVKNGLTLTPVDLATLLNPQAGDLACDINDSNKIKRYDAATSAWAEVGSGGVGSLDILFAQDFESASLSSFTQTGLALDTVDPLHGKVSAKLTHQAAINQSFKQVIAVDRKFRGQAIVMRLNVKSSASAGNVTISVYDETNAASLLSSTQLQLSNDVDGVSNAVSFTIPSTSSSISYTITALPEAGSPVTFIDDIVAELSNVALLETSVDITTPIVTEWANYTPVVTNGSGAISNFTSSGEYRRVGDTLEVSGLIKFSAASGAFSEINVSVPSGLIIDTTKLNSSVSLDTNIGDGSIYDSAILLVPAKVYYNNSTTLVQLRYLSSSPGTNPVNVSAGQIISNTLPFTFGASDSISYNFKVPIVGWEATETTTKTIPLTQSGLVQEADSAIAFDISTSFGSSSTNNFRFGAITKNIGDNLQYNPSSTLGDSITVLSSGVYNISASAFRTSGVSGNGYIEVRINSSTRVFVSGINSDAGVNTQLFMNASGSLYLQANDSITIVRVGTSVTTLNNLSVSYQGSLKQVTVNPNSRITIPTSELRFTGSTSRGTADSGTRVKFDTLASIRGDAFIVTNDAIGTSITMKKAGILSVSSSLVAASTGYGQIVVGNKIASSFDVGLSGGSGSWGGSVAIGDIIYVVAGVNPNGNVAISLYLSFQEQDISVSVTNTLPQFSDSDSNVRVTGWAGVGSTGSKIGRYSSVLSNIGTDIEYIPSSINGDSFVVKSSGIYNINSFFDGGAAAGAGWIVGLSVDSPNLAANIYDIPVANQLSEQLISSNGELASVSWQGYLTAGQIIRAQFGNTLPASVDRASFTISKVGKPNVTGVDVTPFVNLPQPESHFIRATGTGTKGSSNAFRFGTVIENTNNGVVAYTDDSTNGTRFTALKSCSIVLSTYVGGPTSSRGFSIRKNGVLYISETSAVSTSADAGSATINLVLVAGDYVDVSSSDTGFNQGSVNITATALSDQILTAPETFSTDTASLRYANASEYTLSTLQNAPVGTYITFTYAANTNTRTQTTLTNRPTQTDADMNANGIQIFTRAYNASSTAAQPAAIAIQIGKGLKGRSVDVYKNASKEIAGSLEFNNNSSFAQQVGSVDGVIYDEKTGILTLDLGLAVASAITTSLIRFNDLTTQTSGYLVINASKNVSLTGMNIERVAARGINTAGTVMNATGVTMPVSIIFDTHGALNVNGTFTAPETGYYQINAIMYYQSASYAAGNAIYIRGVKNGNNYSVGQVFRVSSATTTNMPSGSYNDIVYLLKGDNFKIEGINERGATALDTGPTVNYLSIAKVNIGGKS